MLQVVYSRGGAQAPEGGALPTYDASYVHGEAWADIDAGTGETGEVVAPKQFNMTLARVQNGLEYAVFVTFGLEPEDATATNGFLVLPNGGLDVTVPDGWVIQINRA